MNNSKFQRNLALDFMRFVFAVIIMLHHGRTFTKVLPDRWFHGGYIAVEFFFLVSGCMLIRHAEKATNQLKTFIHLQLAK